MNNNKCCTILQVFDVIFSMARLDRTKVLLSFISNISVRRCLVNIDSAKNRKTFNSKSIGGKNLVSF